MKACKDCIHCNDDDVKYPWCGKSEEYEVTNNYYTGKQKKEITVISFCDEYRRLWPIFGGCGKMAVYFKAKEKKDE